MRKIGLYIFVLLTTITLHSYEFKDLYISKFSKEFAEVNKIYPYEFISIKEMNGEYFVNLFRPSLSGVNSMAIYCMGYWDGEQIVLDNGFSVYGIKPNKDGSIFYYTIKDDFEYPGKDFYPFLESDFIEISNYK